MAREIVIKFVADTKEFNAAIASAKLNLQSAATGGSKEFNTISSAIRASTAAITAFGVAGVAAFEKIGRMAIDAAIKIDRQVNTLKALTGSAEAATKRFQELFKLAQLTPGLTTTLATSLDAQLRVLNVTEKTINRILPAVGRLNAISPIEDPRRFAQNLGQLVVKNFETRDLRELFNASPLAGQLIKDIFNVNSPTNAEAIRVAAKRLGITTLERFAEEFAKAAENNPALKNATESLAGQFEKLQDRVTVALAPIGDELLKAILPATKELVQILEETTPKITQLLRNNRDEVLAVASAFVTLTGAVGQLIGMLGRLDQEFGIVRALSLLSLSVTPGGPSNFLNALRALRGADQDRAGLESRLPSGISASEFQQGLRGIAALPKVAPRVTASGGLTGGGGSASRRREGIQFLPLTASDLVTSENEANEDFAAIAAIIERRGRATRQRLTKQSDQARRDLLNEGRDTRRRLTAEADARALEAQQRSARRGFNRSGAFISDAINRGQLTAGEAELLGQGAAGNFANQLREVLAVKEKMVGVDKSVLDDLQDEIDLYDRLSRAVSNSERFMRGFNSQVESIGDAFDRFGANVARAFGNVKTLFEGLKQAVLGFFNDLLGNALQNLVRGTLGGLFGKIGGIFGSPGQAAFGGLGGGTFGGSVFNAGGGISAPGSISAGLGGIFGGGGAAAGRSGQFTLDPVTARELGIGGASKFSFSGLGQSLAGAAPFLGLGLGGSLGGKSLAGNILGSAGGFLGGAFLAASVTPGLFSAGAAALFSNPLTAIAGAGLLVGSLLLGKASQRKKDEQASGEFLAQALAGIDQLANQISSDQIDGSQARAIFDSQILNVFKQQIGTLKTASVVKSRLTNQVRDLEAVYQARIPGQIIAQQQRRATAQQNAITHSKLIPEFATGGTTGGGLALLHPGEKVLNLQQQAAVRAVAGPSIFERAGVPGINTTGRFDKGGTFAGGGDQVIVIDNLTIGVGMSKSGAEEIFVIGGSGTKGQRVIVNSLKNAKTNREL